MVLNTTGTEVVSTAFTLGIVDYVVFVVMLSVSAGIGIYFGFFDRGSDTTDEYLLGGKRMKTLPIAISLVASQLSGISVMTLPAEIYGFGVNYLFGVASVFVVIPMLCIFVIPVFYEIKISSCYEYLQLRFNKETRQVVTASFILKTLLYLPVVIFMPSLAFSQVTGVNIHLINGIVCFVCVFYTMLGGIKAVVWTDVFQCTIMIGSIILIAVVGVVRSGGMSQVIDYASEGGRLEPDLRFDLETRSTLWNCFLSGIFIWSGFIGFNQSCVQRIIALPSLSHAKRSLYVFLFSFFGTMFLNCFIGIVIYAKYYYCDPIATKVIEKADRLLPYFVQDIVGSWNGMPGLFISCVFSASLSTISAGLNTLSGVLYLDYVKPHIKHTEAKANFVMKSIVVVIGIFCVCAGLIVEKFNSILQVVVTLGNLSNGIVFGIFILGLFVPKIHGKAALTSLIVGLAAMISLVVGAQIKSASGELSYELLPTRTDGCEEVNFTLALTEAVERVPVQDDGFSLFKMSFYWYSTVGFLLVCCIAIPLSFLFPSKEPVDLNLLTPMVRSWMAKKSHKSEGDVVNFKE